MGSMSLVHWLIVGIVVLLLFGKGRFSAMMGDVAKGLKSFKKGMADEDHADDVPPRPAARLQTQAPLEPNPDRDLRPMPEDRPNP